MRNWIHRGCYSALESACQSFSSFAQYACTSLSIRVRSKQLFDRFRVNCCRCSRRSRHLMASTSGSLNAQSMYGWVQIPYLQSYVGHSDDVPSSRVFQVIIFLTCHADWVSLHACCRYNLAVKPKKGDGMSEKRTGKQLACWHGIHRCTIAIHLRPVTCA